MKGQALFCSALAILLLSSSTDGIPMSGHESDSLVKRWVWVISLYAGSKTKNLKLGLICRKYTFLINRFELFILSFLKFYESGI
ncbi:hypothetical protein BKA69DRAFT_1066164 [Paraphysoderma sedebokerense]|nr:hypothetical protein BKA69DRAFT_1066164 [Paraphysoderma sedebokerense]